MASVSLANKRERALRSDPSSTAHTVGTEGVHIVIYERNVPGMTNMVIVMKK